MSDILPTIYLPSDIRAMQGRLLAAVQGTDNSVRTCGAVDTATRASWGDFYVKTIDYCRSPPTIVFGSFGTASAEQGQQLQNELYAWQQKLAGMGCKMTTPIFNPILPSNDPSQNATLQAIKYVSVIVVAGATAYGVSALVSLLPKGKGR